MCVKEGWFDGDYSRISDSFFDKSVLNFPELYTEQTYYLQKCFDLCVQAQYLPKPGELTADEFPGLVHRIGRKRGDKRLYAGIL